MSLFPFALIYFTLPTFEQNGIRTSEKFKGRFLGKIPVDITPPAVYNTLENDFKRAAWKGTDDERVLFQHRKGCSMAKIEDVAKLAGVSPASVSRFLNNRNLLRDTTAERIQDAITKLNYSPNPIAVGLRTKHTKMIAFIIPSMNNLYYIELFNDIHRLCIEYGYTLCLYSVEEDLDLLKKILGELSEFQYEGIIISYLDEPEIFDEICRLRCRMPVVLISADSGKTDFDMVYLDVRDATYQATKFYIDHGYRRVAFIGGGFSDGLRIIIKEKKRGYEEAVQEAGCPVLLDIPKGKTFFDAPDNMTAGILGAHDMMVLPEPPDSILCSLDIIAIGVCRYLSENGYCVPEDVAVTGFSGTTLANIYNPAISTIVQPLNEMARAALDLLLRRIKEPESDPVRRSFCASLRVCRQFKNR